MDDVRARGALVVGERTFAGAVVGVVTTGGYDPIPFKLFEVYDEGVAAAALHLATLVTRVIAECHSL